MIRDDGDRKIVRPNTLLREAREHRGFSHQEVADAIGLPDAHTVGRWERGEHFPRSHYRRKLCELFEKPLEELGLIPQEQHNRQREPKSSLSAHAPEDLSTARPAQENAQEYKYEVRPSFTSFVGRAGEIARVWSASWVRVA
jgi:transcriptional regulator with XRE-family HTH domain